MSKADKTYEGNGSFAAMMSFSTGAVVNYGTNNVDILLVYDNGTFADVVTNPTEDGSYPIAITIGDFNSDDGLDIAIVNRDTDNVGILLGYDNGSFSNQVTYSIDYIPGSYSVAVGDFNSDNRLDIVVTNSETDNIVIFRGFGNGTFVIGAMYSTRNRSRLYAVVIADFSNENLLLLYGFENGTSYPLGYDYRPYSIAVTDVNQDKWMDIVTAYHGTDNVEILMEMCS